MVLSNNSKSSRRKLRVARLGFAQVGALLILAIIMIPAVTRVSAGKTKPPPPPPSTGRAWIKAYNLPETYNVAEGVAQASSGGFLIGGRCTGGGCNHAHLQRTSQ